MAFVNKIYKVCDCQISVPSLLSYVVDWLTYLLILAAAANWDLFAATKYTDFSIDDISIMHFYKSENETYAPVWYLLILVLVIPLVMVVVCCIWFLRHKSKERMLWDMHAAILGSLGCCSTQLLLVVIVKNIAAVPRPDFLNRCQPDYLTIPLVERLYSVEEVCQNSNDALIRDGFKSFPSGHSSTVFASQTFLVLFLIGKIKMSGTSYFSWKLVLSIMYPLIISLKVSFSRVSDHRHRIRDVLIGDMIGTFFGFLFYFIYFSNPFSGTPSIAFPPRKFEIDENSDNFFGLKVSSYDIDNKEVPYTESVDDGNLMFAKPASQFNYSTVPAKLKQSFNKRQNRPLSNPIGSFFYL